MNNIKIPCKINLDIGRNKQLVDEIIARYGVSRDINQIGTTVYCEQGGAKFHLLQLNDTRHIVSINISTENNSNVY